MLFTRIYLATVFTITVLNTFGTQPGKTVFLENKWLKISVAPDLKSISSILCKSSGRDYVTQTAVPLYKLFLGNNYNSKKVITATDAKDIKYVLNDDHLQLIFCHKAKYDIEVICELKLNQSDSLAYWNIKLKNLSKDTICGIEYPIIGCINRLGNNLEDDAILYPLHEGQLYQKTDSVKNVSERYPGQLSAQLMYYFDKAGGLYYAAYDGAGYPKDLKISNVNKALVFSQFYYLPIRCEQQISLPYEVATGCFGGRWEAGASVYRSWTEKQVWTAKTIEQRDIPEWLKQPNLFINANLAAQYKSVAIAGNMIKGYHDFFDVPVVTAVFGWEKNGSWMGPDYFPPNPNEQYYEKLSKELASRGDHLYFYTSGFRWGVRKTIGNKAENKINRKYTAYNSTEAFMKNGADVAVRNYKGEMAFIQPGWADNYLLCAGSSGAQKILDSCYEKIYSLGVSGIDLDQNIGCEVEDCFAPGHEHPIGAGLWQTHSMEQFLSGIQLKNIKQGKRRFQGVEETCERYIPFLDVYHGRAYTAAVWPVIGKGAVSVPLYIYLYHPYHIGYAGWIDESFSPYNYVKYGIGRAFIFGMYPGVRVAGNTNLNATVTEELLMLKSYVQLMKLKPEIVLSGKMISMLDIQGADYLNNYVDKNKKEKTPLNWLSVQGVGWKSSKDGRIAYVVANLSGKTQRVMITSIEGKTNRFQKWSSVLGAMKKVEDIASGNAGIELSLQPWELAIIENK